MATFQYWERKIEELEKRVKALEKEPTFDDECQKDMDEAWEQIQKKRKRIPVTLDLTPCDDAISREAFIKRYDEWMYSEYGKHCEKDALAIRAANSLPSVTQKSNLELICEELAAENDKLIEQLKQNQKSGKWIEDECGNVICSECKRFRRDCRYGHTNYCNHCGAYMGEPQESEDKE